MTVDLTRDEHLVLDCLGAIGPLRVDRICGAHRSALDRLVEWRLAVLVGIDQVALTGRGLAVLKRLGPWEPQP